MSSEIYLDKEDLSKWSLQGLRDLKRELSWALKSKEEADKITVYCIQEYEGFSKAFLSFENALKYVMENTEKAYKDGLEGFINEGRPSYIKLEDHASRITTRLYLPEEIAQEDKWFILDKEEEKRVE